LYHAKVGALCFHRRPNTCVLGALLRVYRIHRNIKIIECVSGHLLELDPHNLGYYVLLSNMFSTVGKWDNSDNVRTMMKYEGLVIILPFNTFEKIYNEEKLNIWHSGC